MILKDGDKISFQAHITYEGDDYTLTCEKKRVGDILEISTPLDIQIPYAPNTCYLLKFLKFEWNGSRVVAVFPQDDWDNEHYIKIAKQNLAQLISACIPIGG